MSSGDIDLNKMNKLANKGNLMAILVTVEDGDVVEVFGVKGLAPGNSDLKIVVNNAISGGNDVSLSKKSTVIDSIGTLYAESSPGCRYVKVGGVWKKVCT